MDKRSQNSKNSKFAMSLQYLKKEIKDEVNFLDVDNHQSFVQIKWKARTQNIKRQKIYLNK